MLSNRIAVCRAEKKWTQQRLAEEVGISRQTVTAMENKKYNPSLILAFKVSKALGKPITEVFNYKEEI
ncbi:MULTISPECIES: helix-turn-helix transcriptional regulator [Virgibacillus]|uniref:Putative transcriptional regulator n=1 Tax=Virgibacillus chiguensis TaxID=411959 RepID=A0A1M5S967_9BACI|nr:MULTISPECIES: helix-turn-helix transcriptional regulator [Virgibacillus]SHH35021.1 putative transcriptional regulator [Virgibacillus chiguensis]